MLPEKKTPLGRLTTPEDVADVCLFLCSNLAQMIQGQVVTVDEDMPSPVNH